jgi:hypothetical protein
VKQVSRITLAILARRIAAVNLFSSVAGIEIAANIDLTGFSGKPGGSPNG